MLTEPLRALALMPTVSSGADAGFSLMSVRDADARLPGVKIWLVDVGAKLMVWLTGSGSGGSGRWAGLLLHAAEQAATPAKKHLRSIVDADTAGEEGFDNGNAGNVLGMCGICCEVGIVFASGSEHDVPVAVVGAVVNTNFGGEELFDFFR